MKHTKLLVLVLLVALMACIGVTALAVCENGHEGPLTVSSASPTCYTDGYIATKCEACGEIVSRDILPACAHVADGVWVWKSGEPAQPCQDGVQVQRCKWFAVCGHVFTDAEHVRTVAATMDHDYVLKTEGKDPSCTAEGYDPIYKCSRCGALDTNPRHQGKRIAKSGHDWGAWGYYPDYGGKRATCAWEGLKVRICNRCGAVDSFKEPKTSYHVRVNWADGTVTPITYAEFNVVSPKRPATCTADGCDVLAKCPTCGATDPNRAGKLLPATGHNLQVQEVILPTCTTKGRTIWKCINHADLGNGEWYCDHYKVEYQDPYGHSATWAPASVSPDGTYTVWELRCGRCTTDGKPTVLAMKIVPKGEKAPSGTVNTGTSATKAEVKTNIKGTTSVAKNTTTTKKTTTKKTTTATKTTVKAQPAETAKAVETETVEVTGTALVEGLNTLEGAAVLVKDGKIVGILAEEGKTVVDADKVAVEEGAEIADLLVSVIPTEEVVVATAAK